jgi:hypothetical protein
MAVGDPSRWLRDTPLSAKVGANLADKRRSLGQYRTRNFIFYLSCVKILSGLVPFVFTNKTRYAGLLSAMRATCHTIIICFDLIIQAVPGEEYKYWSRSSCLVQLPITSAVVGRDIDLSTSFPNTLSVCSCLMSETKFHIHTKPQAMLRYQLHKCWLWH